MSDQPLFEIEFEADRLMQEHPPAWEHPNKQAVFDAACPEGAVHSGILRCTRWRGMPLPDAFRTSPDARLLEAREGYYDYEPVPSGAGTVEWHVNFADPHLFVAYSSRLFAQDEMQVAEHPILGALREALDARGLPARTVEQDEPTPILVGGAQRRCRVAIDANAAEERPRGLYGNRFAAAPVEVVRRATQRLEPPTRTNLIAMAALPGGWGAYSAGEVTYTLRTAFTAFRAAMLESLRMKGAEAPALVHTGFWGCGAFGGNRVLMTVLQILAADAAGLMGLVFHVGQPEGFAAHAEALARLRELGKNGPSMSASGLVEHLVEARFHWGTSDGN